MTSNRFYFACLRDNVGDSVGFHCKDGKGYSTDIDKAHVYTLEEAQRAWNSGRGFEVPLCADRVDAQAQYRVDCQKLPIESAVVEGEKEYVGFQKGRWCGNDVFWLTEQGLSTINFEHAKRIPKDADQNESVVLIPFSLANKAKRRTLDTARLNRRKMVQAAGLVTPERIKREKRRKGCSKTRFNCPGCGQIQWQYNPYDFNGCNNTDCEKWSLYSGG